jgi:glycine/D-amino acid oxidase-like deaminating enzyme
VVVVGGGFSGLWTAYHLLVADPALRIVVVERDVIGFGASGRNGGWLMGAPPADLRVWEKRFGLDAVRRAQGVLVDAVQDVAAVVRDEGIRCDLRVAGALTVARSAAEAQRLRAHPAELVRAGWPTGGVSWVSAGEVEERVGAQGTLGGIAVEPCATLNPVDLVRGLADAVVRRGGQVYERTPVVGFEPGGVRCEAAVVRAPRVVLATEAFTVQQPGEGRRYLPLASTMIATAPLPRRVREEIGWSRGEAVGDAHHLFFYAQLTPDGRIAIGGRGAPYKLGSALSIDGAADVATTARLEQTLSEVWPQAEGVPIEHRWSGSLAVPRDWCASCGVDSETGIAWIGGYAGHGVGASFVLARSLAAQLRGEPDPVGPQPWTLHRPRRWEPEPLRWLASQAIVRVLASADEVEAAGGHARRARLVHRFTGS